jgi:hypothetical protein
VSGFDGLAWALATIVLLTAHAGRVGLRWGMGSCSLGWPLSVLFLLTARAGCAGRRRADGTRFVALRRRTPFRQPPLAAERRRGSSGIFARPSVVRFPSLSPNGPAPPRAPGTGLRLGVLEDLGGAWFGRCIDGHAVQTGVGREVPLGFKARCRPERLLWARAWI